MVDTKTCGVLYFVVIAAFSGIILIIGALGTLVTTPIPSVLLPRAYGSDQILAASEI